MDHIQSGGVVLIHPGHRHFLDQLGFRSTGQLLLRLFTYFTSLHFTLFTQKFAKKEKADIQYKNNILGGKQ